MATAQAANLSRELTAGELRSALKGIKDSCPGLGGIPYSLYAVLHIQLLPLIADCWNYSKVTGRLPATQNLSCINLIPKKDKDLSLLKNWRPISMSTTDIKLITRAYSLRIAEILPDIIDPSQVAYIPGRDINFNN